MNQGRATPLRIGQGLLLAAAYVVTGKLGLMLALPPGYVSAIFPGAGVAVAATQIRGNGALPWLLLGSLALNAWVGGFQWTNVAMLAALGIAVGSCLQAWLGGALLRRALGPHPAIDSAAQVSLYLALAPIICLVSATVSVGSLVALGIVPESHAASRWVAWWIGDSLGLVTVLPLAWVFFGQPRELWQNRRLAVTSALLAGMVFVVSAYVMASRKEHENSGLAFHLQAQQFANHLQDALHDQSSMLLQLDAFMSLNEDRPVSRVEFTQYVRPSLARFPHLQAIEWVPLVGDWRREAFEREQRADQPRFAIWERDNVGSMVSAAQRAEYFPVTYIAPEFGNQAALGFDLGSNPVRRAAILEAMASEPPVATAPIRLVQEEGEQASILLLHKVSAGKNGPGLVLVVIRVGDFLDAYIPKDVDLRIRLTDTQQSEIVYGRPGPDGVPPSPAYSTVLTFGGRNYLLEIHPGPGLLTSHLAIQSWGVLVGGLIGIGLLGGVLLLMTGQTARIQGLVAARTQELATEKQRLSDFSNSSADWFWEMDADLRYTFLSKNFASAFGLAPSSVLGLRRPELLAKDNLNPPELIASHVAQIQRGETFRDFQYRIRDEAGALRWISVSGVSLFSPDGRFTGYRGTGRVITAEKNAEEALRISEQRYRGLYESLSDAFGAVDMSGRMVEWNQAFREMIGYTDEEVRSLTYQQLTPPRWHPVDEKVVAEQVLPSGHSTVYEKEYIHKDGHVFPVELRVFLIRGEGGEPVGMSAIVRDISARKALEAELADYRNNLEQLVETRTADLQIAKEAAEAASRAKSAFLTIASHELRTPMHGIMGTIT
ncbi:MAG: PAS domain S-box protein, partial [Zoogloeaceae bacterium]|nr:PAS domain S-box protein [Zoogloeaceae bacterium]